MRLRLTPRARQDIKDIGSYLYPRNPSAAAHVRAELRRYMNMLAEHPHAGRAVGKALRRFALPRLPYAIIYRVDAAADVLAVATIRHTARRPLA